MRTLAYATAVAAIAGLTAMAPSASAGTMGALGSVGSSAAVVDNGVTQVHGWHCSRKFSQRRGWHRHRDACNPYRYRYHRPYGYYYGQPYTYGMPFFGFYFDNGRNHRRHHRNW